MADILRLVVAMYFKNQLNLELYRLKRTTPTGQLELDINDCKIHVIQAYIEFVSKFELPTFPVVENIRENIQSTRLTTAIQSIPIEWEDKLNSKLMDIPL